MPRFLTVVLLLTIFFLVGLVFGMNQELTYSPTQTHELEGGGLGVQSVTNDKERNPNSEYITTDSEHPDTEESSMALTLTQKTASLLEKGIKGFSEVVVGILHQIALLFF